MLLYSTFQGIYCALLDQTYHAAFFFLFFYFFFFFFKSFNQVIRKEFQQAEETEWLHYEMRTDLTLPNFQHAGSLPLLWRKLRGLQ